jgi:hypothetical protein
MEPERGATWQIAAVVLGVPVRLVDVVGDASTLGRVRHGLEQVSNREDARKRMLIILAGQIEGADSWDQVPSWPLDPNATTDEFNLHALADFLGLDERGYEATRHEAHSSKRRRATWRMFDLRFVCVSPVMRGLHRREGESRGGGGSHDMSYEPTDRRVARFAQIKDLNSPPLRGVSTGAG